VTKVIHTADWQLGKPFGRLPDVVRTLLGEARLDVIDAIAGVARSKGAGHVLVAGDVFDNPEPGDRLLRQALSRMRDAGCTWWLLPGNHDYARSEGLWSRLKADAPENVRALTEPVAVQMDEQSWILPAPLAYRRTMADPTAILDELTTPPGAIRIGLGHGSIQSFGSEQVTNLVAPDRAMRAGLDYLALGDWHGFLTFGDRSAYSGTPEPDGFGRETTGGVVVVDVEHGRAPVLEFVPTARFQWKEASWQLDSEATFDRELQVIREQGALAQTLLKLSVTGITSLADRVVIVRRLSDELAHELRWLDADTDGLNARPTEDDLRDIDTQGALAVAADSLKLTAAGRGPDAVIAAAALERLYVETIRATRLKDGNA
jgi:DNA repair exonuclease SbcCD nuclease subunit